MTYIKRILHTFCSMGGVCLLTLLNVAQANEVTEDIVVDDNSLTVISSTRIDRRTIEYVVTAAVKNTSDKDFTNVSAQLVETPTNVTLVDGSLSFGDVAAGSVKVSEDTFTMQVRRVRRGSGGTYTWQAFGNEVVPPPPPPPPPPKECDNVPEIPQKIGSFIFFSCLTDQPKWIPITRWEQGAGKSISSAPGGAVREESKLNISDMVFVKNYDDRSVSLRNAMISGTFFEEVKIVVVSRCGDNKFYTYYDMTITDGILSQFASFGSAETFEEQAAVNMGTLETLLTSVDRSCKVIDTQHSFKVFD